MYVTLGHIDISQVIQLFKQINYFEWIIDPTYFYAKGYDPGDGFAQTVWITIHKTMKFEETLQDWYDNPSNQFIKCKRFY